jgi:hypothetical protein
VGLDQPKDEVLETPSRQLASGVIDVQDDLIQLFHGSPSCFSDRFFWFDVISIYKYIRESEKINRDAVHLHFSQRAPLHLSLTRP